MNASNKIIFLYHFLMKRDRVSEAEMILYTYPKFRSQEQYGIKYNDIRYIGKWRQCQCCWVMVHLFNLFCTWLQCLIALECNISTCICTFDIAASFLGWYMYIDHCVWCIYNVKDRLKIWLRQNYRVFWK